MAANRQSALKLLFPTSKSEVPWLIAEPSSGNLESSELDEQIWELVALTCRELVLPWFTKLTRDRQFFQEVVIIVTHVIRNLVQRVIDLDLPLLLLADIPDRLQKHYDDYRTAAGRANTPAGGELSTPQLFASLQPHIAILPSAGRALDPKLPFVSPAYMMALVENILRSVLPSQDLGAATEFAVIRDALVYVVFGNLFTKLAQPWFIHTMLIKFLQEQPVHATVPTSVTESPPSFWARICTKLKQIRSGLALFQRAFQRRSDPILSAHLFKLLSSCLLASERPCLQQSLWWAELSADLCGGTLDSAVRQAISQHFCTPETVNRLLHIAETVVFPDGHPAPNVPDPSPEEQTSRKAEAERLVAASLPQSLLWLIPGVNKHSIATTVARDLLDPLSNWQCNVTLITSILEVVVLRLFPEMALPAP